MIGQPPRRANREDANGRPAVASGRRRDGRAPPPAGNGERRTANGERRERRAGHRCEM